MLDNKSDQIYSSEKQAVLNLKKINKTTAIFILIAISLCFLCNVFWVGITALVSSFEIPKETTITKSPLYTPNPLSPIQDFDNNLIFKSTGKAIDSKIQVLKNSYFNFNGVENDIYKDKTGRLTYVCPFLYTDQYAKTLIEFEKALENQGSKFMYIQAPFKILKGEDNLYYNITDYSNQNADKLVSDLKLNNVNTYDLRNVLTETNRKIDPLFYFTDSRWTINAAFLSYTNIMEQLVNENGLDRSQYKMFSGYDNFILNVVDKCFIGNQAKDVGRYYTDKIDNFDYFSPYARTDFDLEMIKKNGNIVKKSGDYATALLSASSGEIDKFSTYLGPESPKIVIKNNMSIINEKVLILGDDFINPFATFMSLNFKETHVINPSLYKESITDYINEVKPDYVFMLYNPQSFQNPKFFDLD